MTNQGMQQGPVPTRLVKLRAAGTADKDGNHNSTRQVSIPADIARAMPGEAWFQVEVVPEGLLFRYIGSERPEYGKKPVAALPFLEQGD